MNIVNIVASMVAVGACTKAAAGLPVTDPPASRLNALFVCLHETGSFRPRENAQELTGPQAAMLRERLLECLEGRTNAVTSESINQRKGK